MRKTPIPQVLPSEITPLAVYLDRRRLMAGLGAAALGGLVPGPAIAGAPLEYSSNKRYSTSEARNSFDEITTYNNFYEFGTGKEDPSQPRARFARNPGA